MFILIWFFSVLPMLEYFEKQLSLQFLRCNLRKLQTLRYFNELLRDTNFDLTEINALILKASFSTLTNVNFDDISLVVYVNEIDTKISKVMNFCNNNIHFSTSAL